MRRELRIRYCRPPPPLPRLAVPSAEIVCTRFLSYLPFVPSRHTLVLARVSPFLPSLFFQGKSRVKQDLSKLFGKLNQAVEASSLKSSDKLSLSYNKSVSFIPAANVCVTNDEMYSFVCLSRFRDVGTGRCCNFHLDPGGAYVWTAPGMGCMSLLTSTYMRDRSA